MNVVSVHFENESLKYTFSTDIDQLTLEQPVVVETQTGLELGFVASKVMDVIEAKVPKDREIKPVVRIATVEDLQAFKDNKAEAKKALAMCSQCVQTLNLEMDLVSANYSLDRSKILFTYVAEHRVDFRELLKLLNAQLHCRVELRQIAIRQRAKFIGGLGPCGRSLCCATFMNDFHSVSINLAKNQGLSLNASKLTGQCGKLKCCLRFEDDIYTELNKDLPKLNSWVEFEGEKFKVASLNLLSNYVRLDNPIKSRMITVDELKELATPTARLTKKAISEIKESGGRRLSKDVSVSDALKENKANRDANKTNTKTIRIDKPISSEVRDFTVEKSNKKESVKESTPVTKPVKQAQPKKSAPKKQSSSKQDSNVVTSSRRFFGKPKEESTSETTVRKFKSNAKPKTNKPNAGSTIRIIEEHEAE